MEVTEIEKLINDLDDVIDRLLLLDVNFDTAHIICPAVVKHGIPLRLKLIEANIKEKEIDEKNI